MEKRTVTAFIALLGVLGLLVGCGGKEASAATEAPQTAETVAAAAPAMEEPAAVPDEGVLAKYLVGITDRNVLQGSADINYLSEADSMKQVITGIDVDDHEVDTAKAGTYTVRYKITVSMKNLEKAEAYIREHPEAAVSSSVPADAPEQKEGQDAPLEEASGEATEPAQPEEAGTGQEMPKEDMDDGAGQDSSAEVPEQAGPEAPAGETGIEAQAAPEEPGEGKLIREALPEIPESVFDEEDSGGTPEETVEVIVEKEVKIVTPDEAEEIIKDGGEVWTDGSRPLRADDLERTEDAEAESTAATAQSVPAEQEKEDLPEETGDPEDDPDDDSGREEEHGSGGNQGRREEEHRESPHTHDWVKQTKTVHHDEKGHFEDVQTGTKTVVDEEAWDEPVYETKAVCSVCGYEADSTSEINDHLDTHYDPELGYSDASYSSRRVQVDTIHHPAQTHEEPVYEQEWVVDSEAWDETVVTGYRCRTCGAEK